MMSPARNLSFGRPADLGAACAGTERPSGQLKAGDEKQGAETGMAKTKISSSDLVWIFTEKLRSFDECSPGTNIAIVPSEDGWTAVMGARRRGQHPRCDRRIEQIQKQLREIYVLAKD
jgi:hypothetical protein